MKQKRDKLDIIYVLILLFFSIEYIGTGTISVYRLVIFPLTIIGLGMFGWRGKSSNYSVIIVFVLMMVWYTIARLGVNDNWLFPLFNIPLGVFLFKYWSIRPEPPVDYRKIFSFYSVPHILALLTGLATWQGTRFAGAHNDSNFCSIELLFAIIASYYLLINKEEKKVVRYLGLINLVISGGLLFLAGSRGAFFSLFIVVFINLIIAPVKKVYKIAFVIASVVVFSYLRAYIDMLPDWVDPEQYPVDAFLSRFKPESLMYGSGRDEIWNGVMSKLERGSYFFIPLGREAAMAGLRNEFTHNTFLDFVVENGIIVGLLDLVIIGISILRTGFALLKKELSANNRVFAFCAFALMAQLFTLSAISDKLFWLMILFMMSIPILKRNRRV